MNTEHRKNQPPRCSKFSPYFFLLSILFLFLSLTTASIYNRSPIYDELGNYQFGLDALTGNLMRESGQRMPITALNALPIYFLNQAGYGMTMREQLFLSRIPTVLFSVILALFVFTWAKQLYGVKAALFSLTLFTFCPTITAHSGVVTNDIYSAALIFISVFFFVRYLKDSSLKNLIITSVMIGGAQVAKQTALLIFPIFALILFVMILRKKRIHNLEFIKKRKLILHGFLCLFIVLFIVNAAYNFNGTFMTVRDYNRYHIDNISSQATEGEVHEALSGLSLLRTHLSFFPVPLPKVYVKAISTGVYYNKTGEGHGPIYLLGKLSNSGWWYYFPIASLLKFPLPTFVLLLISIVVSRKFIAQQPLDEFALISSPLIIYIFFVAYCTAQIGVRYLIPILPFLYVFVGKVVTYVPRKKCNLYRISYQLLMTWFIISSISFFPHYISYFNELIGSRLNMYKWLADSNVDWGQNEYYLEKYIENHSHETINVNPEKRVDGTVIVNINNLVGITASWNKYSWLRDNYKPNDNIGYSWLVYRIPVGKE